MRSVVGMGSDLSFEKPFAEVIEGSLDFFCAQCWVWDAFPRFGSLVQAKSNEFVILGCVVTIRTGSMDPMRYPFPYQKTEKELRAEQPQIFEFLKTTFQGIWDLPMDHLKTRRITLNMLASLVYPIQPFPCSRPRDSLCL